ncbi:MAG TPA: ATP-binding protein [Thermoleophilaceae bacterium]|nr:ATP-binding protein [Thermoleophilaceae bacterium]
MLQFALSGLAIVVLLGLAGVELLRNAGNTEALRDAKNTTRIAAVGVAQPNLTRGVLRGDPQALARFDSIMRASVVRSPVVRVKIWTADGRVVYSDEKRLIGARYPLGADDQALLRQGGVDADVSDLTRPENRFERGQGKLIEVYLPIKGPDGKKLMFEAYERQSSVTASSRRLWLTFAPALIGGLLLLQFFQLPLAASLVKRVRRAGEDREALLRRAVEASDQERRRLASVLHDGVVQDLAGVSYGLSAASSKDLVSASITKEAASELRGSIAQLRSLLVDLYPGGLHGTDLRSALSDVALQLERDGLETRVEIDLPEALDADTEELVYRAAREGARNVVKHAGATHAVIRVSRAASHAVVEVEDDGRGLAPAADGPREGHFGLALLRDLLVESGGSLELTGAPKGGALLRVEVPLG